MWSIGPPKKNSASKSLIVHICSWRYQLRSSNSSIKNTVGHNVKPLTYQSKDFFSESFCLWPGKASAVELIGSVIGSWPGHRVLAMDLLNTHQHLTGHDRTQSILSYASPPTLHRIDPILSYDRPKRHTRLKPAGHYSIACIYILFHSNFRR
jgi:hypothetical protein